MMRRPRKKNEKHLDFIRSLPCLMCQNDVSVEAAHVRFGRRDVGKRAVGKGEKPDDMWVVPLCGECHRDQHKVGEQVFWFVANRDPIQVALALFAHTGDHEVGEQIVRGQ